MNKKHEKFFKELMALCEKHNVSHIYGSGERSVVCFLKPKSSWYYMDLNNNFKDCKLSVVITENTTRQFDIKENKVKN